MKITGKLESELKELERELRVELPREIKTALAMGDLRENAEYHAALERQSYVKARIGQIRTRLAEIAQIDLSKIPADRIGLGSKVDLLDMDEDKEHTWEFVLPELADPAEGRISLSSPLGRGFNGRREGDEIRVKVPSGLRTYEILSVTTIHQRED